MIQLHPLVPDVAEACGILVADRHIPKSMGNSDQQADGHEQSRVRDVSIFIATVLLNGEIDAKLNREAVGNLRRSLENLLALSWIDGTPTERQAGSLGELGHHRAVLTAAIQQQKAVFAVNRFRLDMAVRAANRDGNGARWVEPITKTKFRQPRLQISREKLPTRFIDEVTGIDSNSSEVRQKEMEWCQRDPDGRCDPVECRRVDSGEVFLCEARPVDVRSEVDRADIRF